MKMSDIKYLIKFVSKKNYAEDLVAGKLFMRPASYYHILEQRMGAGQGDLGEAGIVDGICIYKHSHVPNLEPLTKYHLPTNIRNKKDA